VERAPTATVALDRRCGGLSEFFGQGYRQKVMVALPKHYLYLYLCNMFPESIPYVLVSYPSILLNWSCPVLHLLHNPGRT